MLHLFHLACALALAPPPCRYYATCVGGVEPILAAELKAARIGASDVTEGRLGVAFTGSAEVGARAVLWSRTALKIMELLSVSEGVHRAEDLYEATREAAEWSDLVGGPEQTISVQAVLGTQRALESGRMRPGDWTCVSCGAVVFASKDECFRCGAPRPDGSQGSGESGLAHSHFTALTVKNAVCDALRERHGWRPSVDPEDADLPLFLYVHNGEASLYRVLSGGASMHKRGYRAGQAVHAAALRETLAAAMLLHAEYAPSAQVLCDPMCGSGTIPIEAALIATDTAPGLLRPPPALTRWPDTSSSLWRSLTAEAREARRPRAPCAILANDLIRGNLALAERAASAAGVATSISFSAADAAAYQPPDAPQLVLTNPPWDVRLEGGEEAWRSLGQFLRRECGGARAWVLSGNKELTQHLHMRASSRLRIENAGSSLALISYDVLRPREGRGEMASTDAIPAASATGQTPKPAAATATRTAAAAAATATPTAAASKSPEPVVAATSVPADSWPAFASPSAAEAPSFESLTVTELKAKLKAFGMPVSGVKAVLVQRLQQLQPNQPEASDAPKLAAAVAQMRTPRAAAGPPKKREALTKVDATGRGGEALESIFKSLY